MDEPANEARPGPAESRNIQAVAASEREILRNQRSIFARLGTALRLADLMAILMVLATFFSAYATWRTAAITGTILAVADRPFLGVQEVAFLPGDGVHPTILVNFKNFGSIPALDTIVSVHAVVEGKVVRTPGGGMSEMDAGIMSPNVPHYFYLSLPLEKYQAVAAGKSNLQVHVSLLYKGPVHEQLLCYFERYAYDARTMIFQASGGHDKCGTEVF
jgi:hypothetical protein